MQMRSEALLAGLVTAALGLGASPTLAAGYFTNGVPPAGGVQYPSTTPLTGNETIPADTNLPSGMNPASEAITVGQLAAASLNNTPRNALANGAMAIAQKGTGVVTGGTTSITSSAFGPDRWATDTNVAGGAGQSQVVTSSPSPPTGFVNSVKVYRGSGSATQPVCFMQAIPSADAVKLQGKYVMLSAWLQALSGMTSVGNTVQGYVITGTGTDQGLGTLTASPAITPAWTGIASSTPANWATTTTWSRYNTSPVLIPTNATEVGVEICFTPTGSASGSTDGFAVTGVQLEPVSATATAPSAFEFRRYADELRAAQQFSYVLNEPASGAGVPGWCEATGSNAGICTFPLPAQMYGGTPTVSVTTGSFTVNIAGTPTTWVNPTPGTCSTSACQVTIGNTNTPGQFLGLAGGGGAGRVVVTSSVLE
jgi:hypothetical protein